MKIYDTYSKFHGKIDLARLVPKYHPLMPMERKIGSSRLSRAHVRKQGFRVFNLFTDRYEDRVQYLAPEFKNILEISCRAHGCPCPFTLDTMIGVCTYSCIYCFTALTISSLMAAFFDSDEPLAPRYAHPAHVHEYLDEILTARGVEPCERIEPRGGSKTKVQMSSFTEPKTLKKAATQRIPLRFGTRSENFLPQEHRVGAALEALKVIRDHNYPLIINTKSDLVIEEPYFKLISDMGENVAIQVTIIHNDDKVAKKLEPGAPPSSKRWEVMKVFNSVGINAMPRMEPAGAFLNDDDGHLEAYFNSAVGAGCKNFMGDAYHYTVRAEEVRRMFYREGFDFDRMWEATSEYQILGSYVMEKAMYYAKKHGLKAGTFNFHSLPYNDDPVCCMVGEQFKNWNKYSLVHWLKSELIEKGRASFSELDEKYYGCELHPNLRGLIRGIWNEDVKSAWNPSWVEGAVLEYGDTWGFDPSLIGEWYEGLTAMQGG